MQGRPADRKLPVQIGTLNGTGQRMEPKGAVKKRCHCEPVTDVTGVAISRLNGIGLNFVPRNSNIREIPTPVYALARNDRVFFNSPCRVSRRMSWKYAQLRMIHSLPPGGTRRGLFGAVGTRPNERLRGLNRNISLAKFGKMNYNSVTMESCRKKDWNSGLGKGWM